MYNGRQNIVFLDVRDFWEYQEDYLDGSILIPLNKLRREVRYKIPNKRLKIYVYCSSGDRSKVAQSLLRNLGYIDIEDVQTLEKAKKIKKQF